MMILQLSERRPIMESQKAKDKFVCGPTYHKVENFHVLLLYFTKSEHHRKEVYLGLRNCFKHKQKLLH